MTPVARMSRIGSLLALGLAAPAGAQSVRCELNVGLYGMVGTCRVAAGEPVARGSNRQQLAGLWPPDSARIYLATGPGNDPPWRGILILPNRQLSFEIARERAGSPQERLVLRSHVSWVQVREWREIRASSGANLGAALLVFDLSAYPPASVDDIAILERALARLDELREWDRADDRNCGNDSSGRVALFCLLVAEIESTMGQYHHHQPALELVRQVVVERWPDRLQGHPLMDFNNHSSTTLGDIRASLQAALVLARQEAAAAP